MTRLALFRLLDTRKRIAARVWAARSQVVRQQLIAMRGTYA